jgi:hypothetical protein
MPASWLEQIGRPQDQGRRRGAAEPALTPVKNLPTAAQDRTNPDAQRSPLAHAEFGAERIALLAGTDDGARNTEGTPARARASTHGYSFSLDLSGLRDFRAKRLAQAAHTAARRTSGLIRIAARRSDSSALASSGA